VQSRTSRNEDVHRSQASEPFSLNTDKGSLRAKRLLQGIFDSQYEHGINVALADPLGVTGNSERLVSTRLRIHKDRQDLNGRLDQTLRIVGYLTVEREACRQIAEAGCA
jgi:hypothetical protein